MQPAAHIENSTYKARIRKLITMFNGCIWSRLLLYNIKNVKI